MDYNSIDEDDVEKLRLAALMTFKRKSNVPINSISSTSGEFCQNKFSNGNSYGNLSRNTRGRFPTSNRSYNQRIYSNVGFRRPTHANNNLIAIIPTDSEGDSQTNDSSSKDLTTSIYSRRTHDSDGVKSTNIQSLNDEVSTKFSRLENDSGSDESEDSEAEKDGKDESDDGDVLLLGEEDEDLDDLDKLMDIMEAEIAGGDVKSSKKEKKNLKQNKNKKEKGNELKIKNKLNIKKQDEPIVINQPKIIEDSKQQLNLPDEELESIKTLEEIRNSPSQCNLLKPCMPLRSPTPPSRKRSISPYNKLRKRSLSPRSPRRRSPTVDRYRYSPARSRVYRRSISPRRSPRRLSPLREKNLSPRRYSPKSRYPYRSPSPRRRRRSLSRDISPSRRRLSPLRRRSRSPLKSKSRSPKVRPVVRRRSPSPLKKMIRSSRPLSPNIRRKDKLLEDNLLKKREKVKLVDKQIETKSMDPILEARKRKFESNKPIESTSKKIVLKKTNSVQVAIQTENKETQNEKIDLEIKPKDLHLRKKLKNISQAFQAPKNISIKMNNDLETINLRRVVKVNTSPEKINYNKRPRIIFGNDETSEMLVDKEDKCNTFVRKKSKKKTSINNMLPPETLEVSSTSGEELSEEELLSQSEENEDEESEKEDGQESSNCDEYIEEEEDEEEEEEDVQEVQVVDEIKEPLPCNDTVDLRTELKRRRALRLNMIQVEVKKKPDSFYPARLLQSAIRGVVGSRGLQSAIRGVVGSSSTNEVKRKKHSKIPEISIKTEGNSDGRRVIVMNREKNRTSSSIEQPENQEDYNELESYATVKQLKGKLKKVPVCIRTTGVTNDNTIQKGLKKINKRNINVTDFDQM